VTDRFPRLLAAFGSVMGVAAAIIYFRQGLTLSHYDAKAHLVVARRVLDSLTPEYSQIGAVWLPLPHLLNLLPVQIDALYRTGLSAVAISVASFVLACYAIAHLVQRATRSHMAAGVATLLFALDPDVLYLQSTPMTEPLLFALVLMSIKLAWDWVEAASPIRAPSLGAPDVIDVTPVRPDRLARVRAKAGWALVAACLTRYEAWLVTAAILGIAAFALWRRGLPIGSALRAAADVAIYPVLAVVCFFFHSWFTTGAWFVTGGFYVADNVAHGNVYRAVMAVMYGVRILIGRPLVTAAIAGTILLALRGLRRPEHAASLLVLALAALIVLPAYAFFEGHPFRMRYLVAPAVGAYVFAGVFIGFLFGPLRFAAAVATVVWLFATANPIDAQAPMVQEAQWDVPFSRGRRIVSACLMREYRGEQILASMGSLAHYMQELSHYGINIRDFVHEGNLPHWQEAIEAPQGRVGWILVEERAEGGDMLATRVRESSAFTTGFVRLCADGGVALYRSTN
jgi:hypothetical protein